MITSLVLAAASGVGACLVPTAEAERQVALSYAAFDGQPQPFGWRSLSASGCTDAAVALLTAYAGANEAQLDAASAMELWFHVGQALALAGREQESIGPFERALHRPVSREWAAYVQATLAFLRRDAVALAQAREAYAAVAPHSMRLKFIDGFIRCPDASYAQAVHCRP